jgi:hypothetical protein
MFISGLRLERSLEVTKSSHSPCVYLQYVKKAFDRVKSNSSVYRKCLYETVQKNNSGFFW